MQHSEIYHIVSLALLLAVCRRVLGRTYADVHLDCSPKNQHGRISVLRNGDDLNESHDGAYCCKQSQNEHTYQSNLPAVIDLELQQDWDGEEEDDAVVYDGDTGEGVEGFVVGKACA